MSSMYEGIEKIISNGCRKGAFLVISTVVYSFSSLVNYGMIFKRKAERNW
jgi:hypothetical protein